MTELNNISARTFSRLGQRGAIFGIAACEAAKEDSKFVLLTADLAQLSGMDRFVGLFPDQFVNAGIAEQNMLGMAAGLSAEGYHPVASTYATFLSMRGCEQMRHYFGYMHLKAVLVGSGAGFSQGFSGNTHYTIEDLSIVRAIPNLVVLSPADAGAAVLLFREALKADSAVYMRLTGGLNSPIVYKEDSQFKIGGSVRLREGSDVSILATGTVVDSALKAAEILGNDGISVSVSDIYSIKPIDKKAILELALSSKALFTIEEHSTIGGLGGAVSEVLAEKGNMPKLVRLGIRDKFDLAGSYDGLIRQNRLTPELIAEDIRKNI